MKLNDGTVQRPVTSHIEIIAPSHNKWSEGEDQRPLHGLWRPTLLEIQTGLIVFFRPTYFANTPLAFHHLVTARLFACALLHLHVDRNMISLGDSSMRTMQDLLLWKKRRWWRWYSPLQQDLERWNCWFNKSDHILTTTLIISLILPYKEHVRSSRSLDMVSLEAPSFVKYRWMRIRSGVF